MNNNIKINEIEDEDKLLILDQPKYRSIAMDSFVNFAEPRMDNGFMFGNQNISQNSFDELTIDMSNKSIDADFNPWKQTSSKKKGETDIMEQLENLASKELQKKNIGEPKQLPRYFEQQTSFDSLTKDPEQILAQVFKLLKNQKLVNLESVINYQDFNILCNGEERELEFEITIFKNENSTFKIEFLRKQGNLLKFLTVYRNILQNLGSKIVKDFKSCKRSNQKCFAPPKFAFVC